MTTDTNLGVFQHVFEKVEGKRELTPLHIKASCSEAMWSGMVEKPEDGPCAKEIKGNENFMNLGFCAKPTFYHIIYA